MRKTLALVALLTALSSEAAVLSACGDKFFLVGRGDRFSKAYASLHPGDILVYTSTSGPAATLLRDARLHKHLARAGHRVTIADDAAALGRALRSKSFDIVLTHVHDAPDLTTKLGSLPFRPALLPIVADGDRSASDNAQHPAAMRLKASDNIKRFLTGVEDVLKARAGAGRSRVGA